MKIGAADGIDLGLESTQFTMKTNAKAFQILSSGLYSNKVRAVIRELSCNAHDSHIEAGTADKPFDVQLPSYNNTQFFVRDYGTGLSEEEIYSVYTTYFESTKSDSNEYTGALGLGSKSPFCMADSFTIEAFKDNVHRTFLAFIGKSGMPELSKISEAETNEPNGVKVTVEVESEFYKWRDEAEDLFAWFPVKPNVICEDAFTITTIEPIATLSDKVRVLSSNSLKYSERLVITQGTVVYPVTTRDLQAHFPNFEFLTNMHLQLEVPIGTVDITASRESISFVEYTVTNLTAEFEVLEQMLIDKIEDELARCEGNAWKMIEAVKIMRQSYPASLINKSATLNNHPLASDRTGRFFELSELDYIKKKRDVVTVTEYNVYNGKIRSGSEWKKSIGFGNRLEIETGVHFVVNNTTRGMLPTLRLYATAQKNVSKIVLIDFVNRKKYNTRVVNSVLKSLENPATVIYADKMERPATTSSGKLKGSTKELTVKELYKPRSYDAKWYTNPFNAENLYKMYFVDLDNHTVLDNDYYLNIRSLMQAIKRVVPETFFNDKKICGMTKTQKKRFAKAGIEVKSLFTEIEDYIKSLDLVNLTANTSTVDDAPGFIQNKEFVRRVERGECNVPEFIELVNIAKTQRKSQGITVHSVKKVIRQLNLDISIDDIDAIVAKSNEAAKDITAFANDIYNVCPMIKHFSPSYYDTKEAYETLIKYINNQYA